MRKYRVVDEAGYGMRIFHSKAEAVRFLQEGWSIQTISSPNKYKQSLEKVGEAPF